jgi:two-component system, NtrC family, sensor kinase
MNLPPIVRWATGIRWQWKVLIPMIAVLVLSLAAISAIVYRQDVPRPHWILLAALAGGVILCFVLLSVLLVLVEQPLEELMRTIARVRRNDLTARVEFAKREDDIGQLGRQFNEMIQQLDRNRAEIEELHRRDMGRAEHLATLGELAAGLAHEIRNPLAGIAGVVDVMGKELPAESSSRAVLGDVQNEILHIQNILNDLLSYARPRPPTFHPADLNTTIEQAVLLARQQVRTRPVQVLFSPNTSLPPVYHDPALFQQVVLNLLLNGIQAISGEGKVEVNLAQEDAQALIVVKDTGKGISAEALTKIFKPFFTTRKEGTGLGLSLARGIVQSHAGTIEARSTPGLGTQFRIHIPINRSKSEPAQSAGPARG